MPIRRASSWKSRARANSRSTRSRNLVISTAAGDVIQHAPLIYQTIGGHKRTVPGGYVLAGCAYGGVQAGRV